MPPGPISDVFAAASPAWAEPCLPADVDDVLRPAGARLDERTRLATGAALGELVDTIERDIRRHAARALAAAGDDSGAAELFAATSAWHRLSDAGMLRDPALIGELIAQMRCVLLAERLPLSAEAGEAPGLLLRLIDLPDRVVAAAARALLAADRHRGDMRADLPAELYHRLVWAVAAAIRTPGTGVPDQLLAEAAQRCLAAHDEGERPEALAARLIAAIDPLPAELPVLLVGALGDRRPLLFVGALAQALTLTFEDARALLLDPYGDLLWMALRAVGAGGADIARIALMLAEADTRRDIEAFADRLDGIAAIAPAAARAEIAPLMLPADFRRAIAAIGPAR